MTNTIKMSLVAALAVSGLTTASASMLEGQGKNISKNLTLSGSANLRYEKVSADKPENPDKATAATVAVKIEAGYKVSDKVNVDMEVVSNTALVDKYSPENMDKLTVKDPELNRITKGNITYKDGGLTVKAGRISAHFDNGRIIGNQAWRQVSHSFDAGLLSYKTGKHTLTAIKTAKYWGSMDVDNEGVDSSSLLLNYNYKADDNLKISFYDYMIDSDRDTIGVFLRGKSPNKIGYEVEYATQSDASMGDVTTVDASLMNVDLRYGKGNLVGGVGYTVIKDGFWSSLGNNYKYLGLSDVIDDMISQGAIEGVSDVSVIGMYKIEGKGKVSVGIHSFKAQGGDNAGTEFDVVYKNKLSKDVGVYVGYANYSKGDIGVDTSKLYTQLNYTF